MDGIFVLAITLGASSLGPDKSLALPCFDAYTLGVINGHIRRQLGTLGRLSMKSPQLSLLCPPDKPML